MKTKIAILALAAGLTYGQAADCVTNYVYCGHRKVGDQIYQTRTDERWHNVTGTCAGIWPGGVFLQDTFTTTLAEPVYMPIAGRYDFMGNRSNPRRMLAQEGRYSTTVVRKFVRGYRAPAKIGDRITVLAMRVEGETWDCGTPVNVMLVRPKKEFGK